MSILQTTDLKKHYGTEPNITKALDGVTLSIEQGGVCRHRRNLRQRQGEGQGAGRAEGRAAHHFSPPEHWIYLSELQPRSCPECL